MEYLELREKLDNLCIRYLRADLELSDFLREVNKLKKESKVNLK